MQYIALQKTYTGGRKAERWEEPIRFFKTMQETRKDLYRTKDISIQFLVSRQLILLFLMILAARAPMHAQKHISKDSTT
jgi:hypothetical protein